MDIDNKGEISRSCWMKSLARRGLDGAAETGIQETCMLLAKTEEGQERAIDATVTKGVNVSRQSLPVSSTPDRAERRKKRTARKRGGRQKRIQ